MKNRDHWAAPGLAGALLFSMPAIDVVFGVGVVGPVHLVLWAFGSVLMVAAFAGRGGRPV